METLRFNIHDAVRLELRRPQLPWPLRCCEDQDISLRYTAFRCAELPRPANLIVTAGPFEPDTAGCVAVGSDCLVRRDYIFHRVRSGPLLWQADVRNLEGEISEARVYWQLSGGVRSRLSALLYPFEIATNIFLRPLVEFKLLQQGLCRFHAAGLALRDRGMLISARGSGYKSTVTMEFLRRGFAYIGADTVCLQAGRLYSLPHNFKKFCFVHRYLPSEEMNLRQRLRFLLFQFGARFDYAVPGFPVANGVPLEFLFFQNRRMSEHATVRPYAGGRDAVAARLLANNRLDRFSAYVNGVGYVFAPLLAAAIEAYGLVFPDSLAAHQDEVAVAKWLPTVAKLPCFEIELPFRYVPDEFEKVYAFTEKLFNQ